MNYRLIDSHNALCVSYVNDRVKEFLKQFMELVLYNRVDDAVV